LDRPLLTRLLRDLPLVVTVEEHTCVGGFGSALLEMAAAEGLGARPIACLAIPDRFVEHGPRDLLLKCLDLDADGIARRFVGLREPLLRHDDRALFETQTSGGLVSHDPRIERRSP
jgi:1-deoxy-D-xylulose-5-phosphate synthase